jgi:hypothetical protein
MDMIHSAMISSNLKGHKKWEKKAESLSHKLYQTKWKNLFLTNIMH